MRQFLPEDATELFNLNEDPEVVRYTGDTAFQSVGEAETLIEGYDQYEKYRCGRLSAFLRTSGSYIGWCGLKYHPETGDTDLGYRFRKEYWGRGLATEAAVAGLEYGFSVLGCEKIIARVMKHNYASIRVLQKLGFTYEKDLDDESWVQYQILKKEWK